MRLDQRAKRTEYTNVIRELTEDVEREEAQVEQLTRHLADEREHLRKQTEMATRYMEERDALDKVREGLQQKYLDEHEHTTLLTEQVKMLERLSLSPPAGGALESPPYTPPQHVLSPANATTPTFEDAEYENVIPDRHPDLPLYIPHYGPMGILGPQGSGKTHIALNMLKNHIGKHIGMENIEWLSSTYIPPELQDWGVT